MVVARLLMAALLLGLAGAALPESGASKEYQLKSAFLFNFAQFVEWPQGSFASDDAPIRIGILGEDPFGAAIDDIVRGEAVRGRKLVVQRAQRVEDLKDCHLIFVSRSEKVRVGEILAGLDGRPVLTVSDLDGFALRGGMIRFYIEGNKTRFEINQSAAQDHHIKVSSQLLGLGKVITPPPEDRK